MTTTRNVAAASSSLNVNYELGNGEAGSSSRHPKQRQPYDPTGVRTTDELQTYRDEGKPMLNNYTRHAKIGGGQHGEVWLCYQMNPQLSPDDPDRRIAVAMKGVKRDNAHERKFRLLRQQRYRLPTTSIAHTPLADRLGTAEAKIRKEIAIMKKCRHPHVVRLLEVIDDRMHTKVYMVMEYLAGGEVQWRKPTGGPYLLLAQTRRIMRDAILGLEYLHHQGIIHRDIKPANLLWTMDRRSVKIADFGVSHFSYAQRLAALGRMRNADAATLDGEGNENVQDTEEDPILLDESDLSRRAGTPMFLAPEIVRDFLYTGLGEGEGAAASPSNVNEDAAGKTPTMNGNAKLHHDYYHDPHGAHTSTLHTASTNLSRTGGPRSSSRRPSSPPRPIDKAIDIWALGVTFYCLLFGRLPFRPDDDAGSEWSLYHAIGTKEWTVRSWMCADRIWCGDTPRQRDREKEEEEKRAKEKRRIDEGAMEAEMERWRVADVGPEDIGEEDDSGTESEKDSAGKDQNGQGKVVIELLEKFLQKDPRNRITLDVAKHDKWFLREIQEPEEWLDLTTPRGKITVSTSDTTEAMQPVHFRWKWNRVSKVSRRISSLFKSNKGPPKDINEFMGPTTAHDSSRAREEYDDARASVKSDPAVKMRRYKSSTAASIARLRVAATPPSSPDPAASDSWDSPSPVNTAARASLRGKAKEGARGLAERRATGKKLQSKSIDRWPLHSAANGSRLTVSTQQGPDPSSRSTSAIEDHVIATARRGSLPLNYHNPRGTSVTNTQASSSLASSPTDTNGAWSYQVSRASSKSNFQTSSRPRTRFAQLIGAISGWRSSRFSSSSSSPTEPEQSIKRGGEPGIVSPSTRNRAGMSEEALLSRHSPGLRHSPRDTGPSVSGVLTPDRRASSWGQGDTPGDHATFLGIPAVRSLDSALFHADASSRIIHGIKGLSLNGNGRAEDEDDSELGPACYDDDSSTIASGGEQDDLGGIIRSDSGGEILQPNWVDDEEFDDGDSMVRQHVIHSPPFGELPLQDDEGVEEESEDEQAPVTFSPRRRMLA